MQVRGIGSRFFDHALQVSVVYRLALLAEFLAPLDHSANISHNSAISLSLDPSNLVYTTIIRIYIILITQFSKVTVSLILRVGHD